MRISDSPVTVIIPCLNAESTLGEAIESVLAQTAPPREILVIDDASRDESVQVARSFGAIVRVLANPCRGPGAARRIGVREARGEFIAFIDADDIIESSKHERQLTVLEKSDPHTLVHTGSVSFWPDGIRPDRVRVGGERAAGRCTRVVFENNPVCGASTMLRRAVILELGNYRDELIGTEDFGMSLLASTCCDFVHVPEPLYRMRRHTGNITNRSNHMAFMHWLAQEFFRRQCPEAFAALPDESVRQFMVEPVLRAVRSAYWRRDARDYTRLLKLAASISPGDASIRRLRQRRWLPMGALRFWDRVQQLTGSMRGACPPSVSDVREN